MSKNRRETTFSDVLRSFVRPTIKEYDRKLPTLFKRFVGFLILFAFIGLSLAIMYWKPLAFLTCRHIETNQIDCQLQEFIAWKMIPVRETPILRLQKAYVHEKLVTGEDEDGNTYTRHLYQVILVSASGEIALGSAVEDGLSAANHIVNRINDFRNSPLGETMTVGAHNFQEHTWLTIIGGTIFIFFGFVTVGTIVNTIVLLGAWAVEFVLFIVVWLMDRFELSSELKERIIRFRGAIRGIAIPP